MFMKQKNTKLQNGVVFIVVVDLMNGMMKMQTGMVQEEVLEVIQQQVQVGVELVVLQKQEIIITMMIG